MPYYYLQSLLELLNKKDVRFSLSNISSESFFLNVQSNSNERMKADFTGNMDKIKNELAEWIVNKKLD